MVAEVLCVIDYARENVFFFRLEREIGDFGLPVDQIFEFWAGSVARDFDAPVTDGAGVFFVFLDFPTGDLKAFAVIPVIYC